MHSSDLDVVRALPLFCELTAAQKRTIFADCAVESFAPHTLILEQGSSPTNAVVVLDGGVELFANWDGRETVMEVVQPVAAFGMSGAIFGEAHLKSARALTATRAVRIPSAGLRRAFAENGDFARAVAAAVERRYRDNVRILIDQKLRTSAERLANWILKRSATKPRVTRFELPFEKRTLASRLGMTPENLSRNLALLKKHGVVSAGKEIVIEDRAALERFAKPDALIDG
jgi:CRP/FNR family transcriptional activator FtrB